jgi:hypothetical protein
MGPAQILKGEGRSCDQQTTRRGEHQAASTPKSILDPNERRNLPHLGEGARGRFTPPMELSPMSISSPLLIQEPPLQVLPSLAVAVGLEEAIVLQQLHYWMMNPKVGEWHDDMKWIYNTYEQWHANFPFWSASGIRKFISRLESQDLILSTDTYNEDPRDRTKWYTLNYELLSELTNAPAPAGQFFNKTETTRRDNTETNYLQSVADEDSATRLFNGFWLAYPRKEGKASALKAWRRIRPNMDQADRILTAVMLQTKNNWHGREKQYIPLPASWLNGERWEDEIVPPKTNGKSANGVALRDRNGFFTAEGLADLARRQGNGEDVGF